MSSKKAAPSGSTVTIDAATLVAEDDNAFANADAARVRVLGNLASLRTARTNVMQRVRTNLATKLGATAPEVAALDATLASDADLVKSLNAQHDLASKPAITAEPDETVVQGFVRDASGKGVGGVKLDLAQPKGEPVATVTTAKDGHFLLRHKAAAKADVPAKVEVRVHDKRHPTPIELERSTGVSFVTVNLEG